ncbi:MAG: protein kinase, partial [Planctomycetes bacterium]|nr:protein kinase [Planctomycetota bacterium]
MGPPDREAPPAVPAVTIAGSGGQGETTNTLVLGAGGARAAVAAAETMATNLAPPQSGRVIEPPQVIAGYRRVRTLGAGGMGLVYEAVNDRLKRTVALKLLKPQMADKKDFVDRFLRESKAMAAVSHANVVAIYDSGEQDGFLYMALEFVPGVDCAKLLHRRGTLEERDALPIMIGCAQGLEAIHAAGLVHRDIKPQNIFIDREGRPKVGDLGLARSVDGADRMTITGTAWGTPSYMSPEQVRGIADIDIRSDIYALGATLFTLLTGVEPFTGATSYVITDLVLNAPTPDPRTHNKLITPAMVAVIHKAMAKDREARYQTPTEMRVDLERVLGGKVLVHAAITSERTPSPVSRLMSPSAIPGREVHAGRGSAVTLPSWDPDTVRLVALLMIGAIMIALVWSLQGRTSVEAPTVQFASGKSVPWTDALGEDQYGSWADLVVGGVETRFRYCNAGKFSMGSPAEEVGRSPDETRHHVVISAPFWIMSSECTQALYREVIGSNPSTFTGPDRPVEQVSWDDCQSFCEALNRRVPHLAARLPTEAEWEFACRALTDTPFASRVVAGAPPATAPEALTALWRKDGDDEIAVSIDAGAL